MREIKFIKIYHYFGKDLLQRFIADFPLLKIFAYWYVDYSSNNYLDLLGIFNHFWSTFPS